MHEFLGRLACSKSTRVPHEPQELKAVVKDLAANMPEV